MTPEKHLSLTRRLSQAHDGSGNPHRTGGAIGDCVFDDHEAIPPADQGDFLKLNGSLPPLMCSQIGFAAYIDRRQRKRRCAKFVRSGAEEFQKPSPRPCC